MGNLLGSEYLIYSLPTTVACLQFLLSCFISHLKAGQASSGSIVAQGASSAEEANTVSADGGSASAAGATAETDGGVAEKVSVSFV